MKTAKEILWDRHPIKHDFERKQDTWLESDIYEAMEEYANQFKQPIQEAKTTEEEIKLGDWLLRDGYIHQCGEYTRPHINDVKIKNPQIISSNKTGVGKVKLTEILGIFAFKMEASQSIIQSQEAYNNAVESLLSLSSKEQTEVSDVELASELINFSVRYSIEQNDATIRQTMKKLRSLLSPKQE